MRIVFTLGILLVSISGFTQQTSEVIITANCFGNRTQKIGKCQLVQTDTMPSVVEKKPATTHVTLRCGRVGLDSTSKPLLIVDGKLYPLTQLQVINPHTIQNVEILKKSAAEALFGIQGRNGAICVTTKGTQEGTAISIVDSLTGLPIPGATIKIFEERGNTLLSGAADKCGVMFSKQIVSETAHIIEISASEYQSKSLHFTSLAKSDTLRFHLIPIIKTCEEVLVRAMPVCRCYKRFSCLLCRVPGIQIKQVDSTNSTRTLVVAVNKIFPNPAIRGTVIKVVLPPMYTEVDMLRIVSANGQEVLLQLLEKDHPGTITIQTGISWPGGIYIVQLLYANGRVGASSKLILQ